MKSLRACHRAEISLWFEQNKINFSFTPEDFNEKVNGDKVDCSNFDNITADHCYGAQVKDVEEDNLGDFDYSEIYDSRGNWRQIHIRRLIHVMDCFRISHDAYHELRMVSKGHLPPLQRLSKEKKSCQKKFPMKNIQM